ncbi:MAG: LLM class flavin-dependent oxidoreductase [Pseudomonadota bacterium]
MSDTPVATGSPEIWHFGRPDLADVESLAARIEELGFDGMTLTDSQNLTGDTYVALTLAARATSTLKLGPGVTNPLTRHPAVTAGGIASVQAVSGGRAVLGIGRGDSSLFNIGHKPVPPSAFRAYVGDVQRYLSGQSFDTNGYPSQLRWLASAQQAKVPLDLAGTGPKVLAIGAELADRVSFAVGADEERLQWAIGAVRDAVPDGRTTPTMGAYLNVCVHDDIETAAEFVRPGVGIFAHFTGMPGAQRNAVKAQDQAMFDRMGDYDKARHGHPDAAHAQALTLEFIERFAVIGPAEHVTERLRRLLSLGLTRLNIIGPRPDHFGPEADASAARFAAEVLPALKCGTA